MNILYVNRQSVLGETGKAMRARGHSLVSRTKCVETLETIRSQTFDAVVIEDESEDLEIFDLTIRAHEMEPTLPVFVANEWGRTFQKQLKNLRAPMSRAATEFGWAERNGFAVR